MTQPDQLAVRRRHGAGAASRARAARSTSTRPRSPCCRVLLWPWACPEDAGHGDRRRGHGLAGREPAQAGQWRRGSGLSQRRRGGTRVPPTGRSRTRPNCATSCGGRDGGAAGAARHRLFGRGAARSPQGLGRGSRRCRLPAASPRPRRDRPDQSGSNGGLGDSNGSGGENGNSLGDTQGKGEAPRGGLGSGTGGGLGAGTAGGSQHFGSDTGRRSVAALVETGGRQAERKRRRGQWAVEAAGSE